MKGSLILLTLITMGALFPQVVLGAEVNLASRVTQITDGDTFRIETGDRVRMADIDTPEVNEQGYREAKEFLSALIYNKTAYLDVDDVYRSDSYGRLVCVVYVEYNSTHMINANKALLAEGLARLYDHQNEFSPSSWDLFVRKADLFQGAPPAPNVPLLAFFGAAMIIISILVHQMRRHKRIK